MALLNSMSIMLKLRLILGLITIALLLTDTLNFFYIDIILSVLVYIVVAYPIVISAMRDLFKRKRMSEQFLMTIATFGAFALQDYAEALAVMVFYIIGDTFEKYASERSHQEISALVKLKPSQVRLIKEDGSELLVKPKKVKIGDKIRVLSGESIGLDGILRPEQGKSEAVASIDLSALNGESEPSLFIQGQEIPSGGINMGGVIELEVTCDSRNSSITRLINLIEDAAINKSRPEALITRFSVYYTPIVVSCAVLMTLVPLIVPHQDFNDWFTRALVFLVVSCPCALVLSVPLSFFGGLGALSKIGVMVKGSIHIEALAKLKAIAFDKTGTITQGRFSILDISLLTLDPSYRGKKYIVDKSLDALSAQHKKQEVLEYLYALESKTTHPIGVAICKYCHEQNLTLKLAQEVEEITGYGIKGTIDNNRIVVGKGQLLIDKLALVNKSDYIYKDDRIDYDAMLAQLGLKSNIVGSEVFIIKNNELIARVTLADEIKDEAPLVFDALHKLNIKSYMITGDKKAVALDIAKRCHIDEVFYEQLPQDKLNVFTKLKHNLAPHNKVNHNHKYGSIAYVGDGINDAPTLAQSDVGIAMGQFGSAAAVEAADVVIMNDDLTKIKHTINLASRTYALAKQNMILVIGVKALILILGALGFANIWLAILGDVGLCIIAVINAMRPLYWVKNQQEFKYLKSDSAVA